MRKEQWFLTFSLQRFPYVIVLCHLFHNHSRTKKCNDFQIPGNHRPQANTTFRAISNCHATAQTKLFVI